MFFHQIAAILDTFPGKIAAWIFGIGTMLLAAGDTSVNVPVWAFLTVAVSAIGTPMVNAWMRRADKRADWKRQDEVARRVEEAKTAVSEAASSLIKSNAIVASAQQENEKDQKKIRKSLHDVLEEVNSAKVERQNLGEQLQEIHGLVDGQLSAAMESELDSRRIQLTQLREIVELRGGNPSRATLDAITELETKIAELTKTVAERREAMASLNREPDKGASA